MDEEKYKKFEGFPEIGDFFAKAGLYSIEDIPKEFNNEKREIAEYIYDGLRALDKAMPGKIDLVEDNSIYMDSRRNGLAFDWDENEHISPFRIFYDKKKGAASDFAAVSVIIECDGTVLSWWYSDDDPDEAHEMPNRKFKGRLKEFVEKGLLG